MHLRCTMRVLLLPVLAVLSLPALVAGDDTPERILASHNSARAAAGVPPLRWSRKLTTEAAEWANFLIDQRLFMHDRSVYGQNLYEIVNGAATPEMVVGAWTEESAHYDYDANTCSGVCGHYRQVVWRETTEVGCAAAESGNREVWVCDYSPIGNYRAERPY